MLLKKLYKSKRKTKRKSKVPTKPTQKTHSATNEDLYLLLRSQRYALSKKNNVPEYVVAPNKTLEQIAEYMPKTKESMLQINGMGPNRYRFVW